MSQQIPLTTKVSNLMIYLVLILVNIAYCPGIILEPPYKIITAILFGAIGLFMVLNLKRNLLFAISLYFSYALIALIICSVIFIFTDVFIFDSTYNIYLATTCFLLGFLAPDHSDKFINRCFKVYILAALFLGLYSVYKNLGAFTIVDQYVFSLKNSSGVLLATAIVLCIFVIVKCKITKGYIVWASILLILFACLLTFRSRACIIGVILCAFIFCAKQNLLGKMLCHPKFLFVGIIGFIIIYVYDLIPCDFIYSSLFENKDTSDANDISSGRLAMFEKAMTIFRQDPLLANARTGPQLQSVDNFVVNCLGRYGMFGALLMFPPYLFVWVVSLRGIWKEQVNNLYPYLALFLLCIISLTEGSFPFGPGTPVVCAWFLLGWNWKKQKIEHQVYQRIQNA